jgi:hypothetical protein
MRKDLRIVPFSKNAAGFLNIVPATEFIPDWYKESPLTIPGSTTSLNIPNPETTTSTYKKCTPFFDAMSMGYVVFLTADIEVVRKDDGMPFIMWRTDRDIVTEHHPAQWSGLPVPDGYSPYVYKWYNDFCIYTPKDYSLLFTQPINRFDLPFQSITGVVDSDSYKLSVQFPFFIKDSFSGIIEKGTPITQIIPIKRDSWKRTVENYNAEKTYINSEEYYSTIKRSYKKNHWTKKDYR